MHTVLDVHALIPLAYFNLHHNHDFAVVSLELVVEKKKNQGILVVRILTF